MSYITRLIKLFRSLHPLAKTAMLLGLTMMTFFFVLAAACRLLAPVCKDYFFALSVSSAALEAAPASLAVGVCSGLLGDLMLRKHR